MKQQLKREIGVKMRKLRKNLGLTQAEMVAYFDVGRANYSRIEKGEVFPNVTILFTLKTKFNVSLDWLICNEGQMQMGDEEEKNNSSGDAEEIQDLFFHIEKLPMVKHAVLSFFLEYKVKNTKLLQQLLDELETSQEAELAQSS